MSLSHTRSCDCCDCPIYPTSNGFVVENDHIFCSHGCLKDFQDMVAEEQQRKEEYEYDNSFDDYEDDQAYGDYEMYGPDVNYFEDYP